MTVAQLLRIQEILIVTLQLLLLLPLPLLLQASPCPSVEEIMDVATTLEADSLAEALLCTGPGQFAVTWHGDVVLSRTLTVSNGSTLNVTGSSERTDAGTGAAITSNGTILLFEVDLRSTVSLTGLTLSGGNGALRATGGSSIEVINCSFTDNTRTSSGDGGAVYVGDGSYASFGGEVIFANNTAEEYGGAVYVDEGSYASFGGEMVFANNKVEYKGGAIYSGSGSEINVTEAAISVSFFNNHASDDGGAIRLYDQSVFNIYGTASFVSNEAVHDGGAIAADSSELNFFGNISFEGNRAFDDGGAVHVVSGSSASFGGEIVFANNTAEDKGGATYYGYGSELNVTEEGRVSFFNNHAGFSGGAIRLYNQSGFNSYGTVSFVSNKAGSYGADGSELNSIGNASMEGNHIFDLEGPFIPPLCLTLVFDLIVFSCESGRQALPYNCSLTGAVYAYEANSASFGGEMVFANNTAEDKGGAIYFANGSELNVTEAGCVSFFNNHAGYEGGAIRLYIQSVFNSYGAASFVSNEAGSYGASGASLVVLIWGSHADVRGGAFALYGSEAIFIGNALFEGNYAFTSGGAVFVYFESNVLFGGKTLFEKNTAEQNGGAILVHNESVFNSYGIVSFESNEAQFGGAIAAEDSELNFIGNVSFEGNVANASGGSVYFDDGSNVLFAGGVVFAFNTAYYGGAAFVYGASNVSFGGDTCFSNNTAEEHGGAIDSRYDSELIVTEEGSVSFCNNYAVGSGGAIRLNDRSIFKSYGTASFISNGAQFGGAFSFDNSEGNFTGNVSFEGNHANTSGGAIALYDGSIVHVHGMTSFVGNEATHNGGAIYASDSSVFVGRGTLFMFNNASTGSGGGVYASRSVMSLNEAVFTKNHGAWGGGVASFSSGSILDKEIGGVASFSSGSMLDKETSGVASSGDPSFLPINTSTYSEETGSIASSENVSSSSISGEENDEYGPSTITGCSFDGNTAATDGGAVYTTSGYDMIVNSSFTNNFAAAQGGALLHSGVLVALTGSIFESNMAGEDGLAVMSLGMAEEIAGLLFRNNSLFCASGKYGLMKDINETEDPDTCRWGVVCSRCTDQCKAPDNIDMDEATVPVCEVVPEGVNTTANPGMTLETLNLMSGFYRTSNQSREVLECYREEACVGGSNVDRYCAEGYAGPYCAVCEEGHGSGFQYSCNSCEGTDYWATIGGAVAVLVAITFVVALAVAHLVGVVDRPVSERSGMWERRILNFRDGLARAIPLSAIKIVLVSWQIITQFSGVVNVQYPPAYEKFLATLSVLNLNLGFILSLSCVVETNFYARLVLETIAPIAVLVALAITYRVAMVRNGHSIHAMRVAKNKHISVGLFLLFVVYSSVSYTIFQTFVCDPLDSGTTYLRADYELECWTRTHVNFMTYAGIMVLVYPVGIPAVFARVLFINRKGIKNVVDTTINSNGSRVPPESEAIKDLWAPYKPSRYYYEVIECGRRIALTGLVVFIYPGSTAQVAIEALLAFAFSSLSESMSPFAEPLDAWLYRSGTWVIFLSMYLALLLKMDAADEDSHSQHIFAGLLIAAHGGMVLVVIANAFLSALKGFREVRVIEMPPKKSGSASTRENDIGFLEEDEDNETKYNSNVMFAGCPQTNVPPL